MIIYNSKNSFIHLEANKFAEYLKEDGLANAIAYRKEHQEDSLPGKEYYQRCVKTILQVGKERTDASTKPTSLPLDIVPAENVYELGYQGPKPDLKFVVLFNGKPLANKLVKVWHKLANGTTEVSDLITNKNGKAIAKIALSGNWMISCVHMERNASDTLADWQSYWSSITFGYAYPNGKGHAFIKNW
jgi:uncharacterized GH25 family protein